MGVACSEMGVVNFGVLFPRKQMKEKKARVEGTELSSTFYCVESAYFVPSSAAGGE